MIEGAGGFGPGHVRARMLRRRCEKWAAEVVRAIREGRLEVSRESPAGRIALYSEISGNLLPPDLAAVELINLLRPTVAVGRFIAFAGHALHVHREAVRHLSAGAADAEIEAFIQEVRRFYPFFPMIGGRVLEEFSWLGHQFSVGDWVLLDIYGTNRHQDSWPDPDRFDPSRFLRWAGDPYSLIPQGGGPFETDHRCPGEWLTIALMGEATRQLLAMDYTVPEQDLTVPMDRLPALPRSGFVMELAGRS
ncbi:cytochrome P450 [Chelativorans sp.]|uniref:cytochrome P450 n=1 Tax=Chelativorans sp. TaxID=2203393 RepID=UPI002811A531|nr:cytochrome P450 [Chelativorans sp.]